MAAGRRAYGSYTKPAPPDPSLFRRSRWMRAKAEGSVVLLVGASPRPTVNKLNRFGDASELAPLSPQSLVAC